MHPTKVYGHRGAMGEYPENTLLSFEQAILQGVDGLELDVQLTKDGEVVVIHDEMLDRTTNGTGFIKDWTLGEIKQYSAGANFTKFPKYKPEWEIEAVPTLQEVLELLQDHPHIELNIEMKTNHFRYEGIEEKVLELVNLYGEGRNIIYSSFHLPSILKLKVLDPFVEIAWLIHQPIPHPNEYVEIFGLEALHVAKDIILASPYQYKETLKRLRVWTANSTDEIKQLLDLQVNAIITDYPEKALFFRSERTLYI
ncbi:glycerophosphodiester phosphodiesterase [Oceanobacillus luteolus]|uniref:Glycerophosphodiester phosphodiesterase n=1 Tax=Oceanobacillus luteolus TaxID=1274358 RepID=A0ABW4HKY6_9BACI